MTTGTVVASDALAIHRVLGDGSGIGVRAVEAEMWTVGGPTDALGVA